MQWFRRKRDKQFEKIYYIDAGMKSVGKQINEDTHKQPQWRERCWQTEYNMQMYYKNGNILIKVAKYSAHEE